MRIYRIKLHVSSLHYRRLFDAYRASMYDGYVLRIHRLMIIVHKG